MPPKNQLEKATEAVSAYAVKKHVFMPSGRAIYTVLGSRADEFIDSIKPFCSCESFYYGVLSGKVELCYHLLSFKLASGSGKVQEVKFDDEEYDVFVQLLAYDVLHSRELAKR